VTPNTSWLADSRLTLEDGVMCDRFCAATGVEDVLAIGDVSRWFDVRVQRQVRVEHWTNANEHGAIVAADILGLPAPAVQVPYVWSDQYGHRIQIAGRPATGSLAALQGTAVGGDLVALYAGDGGGLVGGVVVDDTRTFMKVRRGSAAGAPARSLGLPLIGTESRSQWH